MMMMSKTQQARSREREREISGQTLPAMIIIAPTTTKHPAKERNGAYVKKRRILEVKSMRIDSNLQIYNGGRPTKNGALEKRVGLSIACFSVEMENDG
jgi:hypothetical protein